MDWLRTVLPRGDEGSPRIDAPLRTAHWISQVVIREALGSRDDEKLPGKSPLILGLSTDRGVRSIISYDDDRHAILGVGSRGGKSASFIVPNLLSYPGSVIVTDPKGELAAITARFRRDVLGQKVIVLDPFKVLLLYNQIDLPFGQYNPLEWVDRRDPELVDEVALLVDALVVKEPRDVHFTESGRAYLKAILLHMMTDDFTAPPHDLIKMRHLGMTGDNGRGISALLDTLVASKAAGGAIARSASMIYSMGDRELGSVISTVGRNTEFLDSSAMSNLVGSSSFDPRTIKSQPTTIYLVLPEWRLGSHHRWLRLVIASLLSHLQRSPTSPGRPNTLLLLDEFAALGHMDIIERAASYIAGFGVKLVTVLQDLNQLRAIYGADRWQTFVANAGVILAFANADTMTAEYLSKRCGETEVLKIERSMTGGTSNSRGSANFLQKLESLMSGQGFGRLGSSRQTGTNNSTALNPRLITTPLITPDEAMVHFARETGAMMALINGARPMRLERIRYWDDPLFGPRAAPSPFHKD